MMRSNIRGSEGRSEWVSCDLCCMCVCHNGECDDVKGKVGVD